MKYELGKQSLKEYFNGLKTHQKILLVATYLFGFAQFLFSVYGYYCSYVSVSESSISVPNNIYEFAVQYFDNILSFWQWMILPPVVMILDIIFLKLRKFSYLVCLLNVVIIFFNEWIKLAFVWNWLGN